jgi:hypothetical protein
MPVLTSADPPAPAGSAGPSVFVEEDGLLVVEAEHYASMEAADKRAWHLTSAESTPDISPDADPPHVDGAGGGAYLEILPDPRQTHDDPLVRPDSLAYASQIGVLTYHAHFNTPGRYYVWVRAFSTGSEDNGIHVGLNGEWPESGRRMQWCEGKHAWRWESRQRTRERHCGVPHAIYLDIDEPGPHTIHFSMREDGFEFDRFLLTNQRDFPRPEDVGPPASLTRGPQKVLSRPTAGE